ncbi:MAG TPA: hypothetical protein VHZ99_09840 [Steroidobacteraceae bacterium]|jgi:hypothetical protein|nr:hypothetical protein [Steroidobacteraceae bacterium]
MAERKPWQPKGDNQKELNPFVNAHSEDRLDNDEINDPAVDSAPLQGSRDLSDEDSLEDVIADSREPRR